MLNKDLQQIGLTEKESNLYLATLELGEANIQQLAKKSEIKRTTAYDIIESLKKRGLISQIAKNKKILFSATNPIKLEDDLEEKRHLLKKILPELMTIANSLDKKPKVRFFEGYEGIKEVYKDTLHFSNSELLAWVSPDAINAFDIDFLDKYYLLKRIEKKIWVRAIASDVEELRKYQEIDKKSLRKTRLANSENFPFRVEINLYGKNKIAIMSFEEKFGMIIESQKIFETLQSIFEINWKALESRNK